MRVKKKIEIILFACLLLFSNAYAEEGIHHATSLENDNKRVPQGEKNIFIKSLIKKHAPQIKGLIPYFDSSELFEMIPRGDLAVVILPYGTSEDEHDYSLSLLLAVVDIKHKNIVQSYFHKDIAQSDAIHITDVILDTKVFQNISKYPTFTVTIQHIGSSRPNPYASATLYMYELKDEKIALILNGLEVMGSGGENNAAGVGYDTKDTLTYVSSKYHQSYADLRFVSTHSYTRFNIHKNLDNTTQKKGKDVVLVYVDGAYENVDLNYLETEAKNGIVHAKTFYAALLKKIKVSKNNVRKYNDIAYYLEQANHDEEAIVILEEILRRFDERVVAHLNIADAYWKLGKKNDAYVHYMKYKEDMSKKKKENKIPKRVNARLSQYKKDFEKLFLGRWKDETGDIKITIYVKHADLYYRVETSNHTWKGKLKITPDGYMVFPQVRWAEYRGDLASERDYSQIGKLQKVEELPVGVSALFDWHNEEFVIQNSGNAMNYYVKFKESDKKYIYFRREE